MRTLSEEKTREKLINYARYLGCEVEFVTLLNKYDTMMRNCSNEQERIDMGKVGAYELLQLIELHGGTIVEPAKARNKEK